MNFLNEIIESTDDEIGVYSQSISGIGLPFFTIFGHACQINEHMTRDIHGKARNYWTILVEVPFKKGGSRFYSMFLGMSENEKAYRNEEKLSSGARNIAFHPTGLFCGFLNSGISRPYRGTAFNMSLRWFYRANGTRQSGAVAGFDPKLIEGRLFVDLREPLMPLGDEIGMVYGQNPQQDLFEALGGPTDAFRQPGE